MGAREQRRGKGRERLRERSKGAKVCIVGVWKTMEEQWDEGGRS